MRQSRLMSLVEAVANIAVGLLVAMATQIVLFPILGLQASLSENLKPALVFTGVSIVRNHAGPGSAGWTPDGPVASMAGSPIRSAVRAR